MAGDERDEERRNGGAASAPVRPDAGTGQLGADGDSDDVADSPTHGHGPPVTPAQGDSDDLADDRTGGAR